MSKIATSRLHGDEYQTALYELGHPETASRISMVGMMHIGTQAYYDTIAAHVAETEETRGSQVHYERLKPMSDEDKARDPELAEAEESIRDINGVYRLLADMVLVKYQKDAFVYQDHWHNTDIGWADLVQLMGVDRVRALMAQAEKFEQRAETMDPAMVRKMIRISYKYGPLISFATRLFEGRQARQDRRHDDEAMLGYRNILQLETVNTTLDTDPDQSFTLLWGPDHLPGQIKGMQEHGYRILSRTWLGALSLTETSPAHIERLNLDDSNRWPK